MIITTEDTGEETVSEPGAVATGIKTQLIIAIRNLDGNKSSCLWVSDLIAHARWVLIPVAIAPGSVSMPWN